MISGTRIKRLFSLSLLSLLPSIVIGEWSLQQLLQEIGLPQQRQAAFTESKESFLLSTPLSQSGILSFTAPKLLRKEVKQPNYLLMTVDGDELTVVVQDQPVRHLYLREQPLLLAFTEAYRALLAGDMAALARHYTIGLTGSREGWHLRLTPRNSALQNLVERIEFYGASSEIASIVTTEANGDRTITKLIPMPSTEK